MTVTSGKDRGFAFKLLDPTGATYPGRRDGSNEMLYVLPRPGEKWGPWTDHPDPVAPDGKAYGPGGFHAHKRLSWAYAPLRAWPWWMEWEGLLGENLEKVRVSRYRLRRIAPKVLWRALRPPFSWGKGANLAYANLRGADLRHADLRFADLRDADLCSVELRFADLCCASLRYADLRYADLRDTKLRHADLRDADLRCAKLCKSDLYSVDLHSTDLRYADLRKAELRFAWLYYTDLRFADLREASLINADLCHADLRCADLRCADLRNAELDHADLTDARIDNAVGLLGG